uniref:Globin CTT-VIII n=2 Tax=Chironomus TaxID=7150 RepID=GLB8_CHITH|nr:RecName: Full=Globin CTT-VIII [Chironomus thummi thummi]
AVTPMSADQLALFKSSWNTVKHNEVDILYAVFKANPDIQAKFPQFAGKDLDSIKDSADFAVHSGRIVGFFSEVIGLIGNPENRPALKTLIDGLASSHKARGIEKAQFEEFRASLVDYLSHHLDWNDTMKSTWDLALNNMFFYILHALEVAQ